MNSIYPTRRKIALMGWLLSVLLMMPLVTACSSRQSSAPPPVDDTRAAGGTQNYPAAASAPQAKKKGLSTGQKAVITLAGAAALYYLYKQHQKSKGEGAQGQYYLSKNGRVYYRDAQHRPHWVTPPPGGVQVPADQAEQYRGFQGYDNSPTGRDLTGLGNAPVPAQ